MFAGNRPGRPSAKRMTCFLIARDGSTERFSSYEGRVKRAAILSEKKGSPMSPRVHAHIDPQSGDCRVSVRDLGEFCAAHGSRRLWAGVIGVACACRPMRFTTFSDMPLWSLLCSPQNCAAAADARMNIRLWPDRIWRPLSTIPTLILVGFYLIYEAECRLDRPASSGGLGPWYILGCGFALDYTLTALLTFLFAKDSVKHQGAVFCINLSDCAGLPVAVIFWRYTPHYSVYGPCLVDPAITNRLSCVYPLIYYCADRIGGPISRIA